MVDLVSDSLPVSPIAAAFQGVKFLSGVVKVRFTINLDREMTDNAVIADCGYKSFA